MSVKAIVKLLIPGPLRRFIGTRLRTRRRWLHLRDRVSRYLKLSDESKNDADYLLSMLRMNAHIVDKGLRSENWRRGRSKSAYTRSKELIGELGSCEDPTYDWAIEIISEYERRQCIEGDGLGKDNVHWASWVRDEMVSEDKMMRHMRARTSVRNFDKGRRITEAEADDIVRAALEAACSCHRQTLRVYCCLDPDRTRQIGECFHGFTCYSEYVPSVWVFCVDLRTYQFPEELFTPSVDTALGVQNAVLYAGACGLSMVLLNWVSKPEAELRLRELMKIPEHESIVVGAACGQPQSITTKPARKLPRDAMGIR